MLTKLLLRLVRFYQKAISPLVPARCRYYPTCSAYAHTALTTHTTPKALILVIKRVLSCQPFGGSGIDFVPVPLYRYAFVPAMILHRYPLKDRHSYQARQNHLVK
ncbi:MULTISPECIES: membrane protein insertion efficiency factor YidD [Moraxella]|uniref:Putative membrane protein insertion efficiency factor n=1 Tax=Moraxella lacunata TaxID=477 RepID=A0A1B8PV31_MORLA|nr:MULTISPECIES: membrane protein insertion efficiency factor YidD [Moraxella]MBE9579310.1 membrane protein insertion efficiency factor YidD [Moraxella sp. K1664]MBE9588653.1 membrane protein insertion efficiency factor YidD [Moraxella sp. K1630]MBE9590596.1 membrane protein insertion efficiency factor YidD [Moraxella sp. K127]MBE9596860.1 membrane protein insertion efficiency factor YidD [Moraxella sp. K2450]MDH9219385.1 membrane protein insertion efficiency factor YidD [Moraxella lacunata]